jgi:uncharacterized protein (DUF885 family)
LISFGRPWDLATQQQQLDAIDRARLSPRSAIHYDIYQFELMRQRAVLDWRGLGRPYVVDQFDYGSYSNIPRLLASQQRVESEDDANAWLARLQTFPKVLDQELECVRFDAAQGIIPPDFIVEVTVAQIEELAQASAADSFVVKSLAAQTADPKPITSVTVAPTPRKRGSYSTPTMSQPMCSPSSSVKWAFQSKRAETGV